MKLTKTLLHTTDIYIQKLAEAGVETVADFLMLWPRAIEDKSRVLDRFSLVDVREKMTIRARVEMVTSETTRNKKLLIKMILIDRDGMNAEVTWWNRRMILSQFRTGDEVLIYGQAKYEYGRLSWSSPEIDRFSANRREYGLVYSDVNYIPGAWIAEKMRIVVGLLRSSSDRLALSASLESRLPSIPEEIRRARGFHSLGENIFSIHAPSSIEDWERAKRELGYIELFHFQRVGIEKKHESRKSSHDLAPVYPIDSEYMRAIISDLPFSLTDKQRIVLFQILRDMSQPYAMARLLQGDVGTGKTIVALLTALHVLHHDPRAQIAIMAPTEILARQHFTGTEDLMRKYEVVSDLLVGSLSPRLKEDVRERLRSGQTQIIFGTHALIQDSVRFSRLTLVVVDEQHRFGVEQRKALEEYCSGGSAVGQFDSLTEGKARGQSQPLHSSPKREAEVILPHRLNMSATPIPRTLALTLYGDQDVSVLDEYPVGRKPIHTKVVREDQREELYRWVEEQVRQGFQVYWISPLVGDVSPLDGGGTPETPDDIASAISMQSRLMDRYPELSIGLIHGKMKGREKDQVMQDFYDRRLDILSSTSVVEVGVNNPNATVIVIEASDRFGLSQLHQFRGRVGRGDAQSYCYLLTTKSYKSDRLKAMEQTNDGFELSEIDLELRGPGEVYGVRQSGVPDFHFADLRDMDLVAEIREDIEEWMKQRITSEKG